MKSELRPNTLEICNQSDKALAANQPEQLSGDVNQFIRDLYGDMSKADLGTFLGLLCDEALPSLLSLEQALAAGDFRTGAQKAHKLRNITSAVGAVDLHEWLGVLEEQLQAGTPRLQESELLRLRDVCVQLVQALRSIREGLS